MNGFCGVMSIQFSLRYCLGPAHQTGHLWTALALMPFGMLFDFFDGMVARWRGKSSLMGAELDSLADLVSAIRQETCPVLVNNHQLTSEIRSLSVSLLRSVRSPRACALVSTSSSLPASSSPVSHVLLASTLPLATCPRTPTARPSTSKDCPFLPACRSWACWHSGCQRAGSREASRTALS
jgi:hypothetical protein